MKLDLHVHTVYSGHTTIYPLSLFMRESYNTPEGAYARAKARGMALVTITDHDRIDGALTIADRPDVIVGCEVTAVFPGDGVRVVDERRKALVIARETAGAPRRATSSCTSMPIMRRTST